MAAGDYPVLDGAGNVIIPAGRGGAPLDGIIGTVLFTPAAAAYGAADIIGVAQKIAFTYADGVTPIPPSSIVRITAAILKIDQTAIISGETSYSLALYNDTPPSARADNDVWTLASADLSSYRGTIALGTPVDAGAACYVRIDGINMDIKLKSGATSLYAELVTAGAFTATAVARQISLYGVVV